MYYYRGLTAAYEGLCKTSFILGLSHTLLYIHSPFTYIYSRSHILLFSFHIYMLDTFVVSMTLRYKGSVPSFNVILKPGNICTGTAHLNHNHEAIQLTCFFGCCCCFFPNCIFSFWEQIVMKMTLEVFLKQYLRVSWTNPHFFFQERLDRGLRGHVHTLSGLMSISTFVEAPRNRHTLYTLESLHGCPNFLLASYESRQRTMSEDRYALLPPLVMTGNQGRS